MSTPLDEVDQFLMGGGGAPSAFTRADGVGVRRGGRITERPSLSQQTDFDTGEPLTWDDGNPRMQLVVTVQTDQRDPSREDDDGRRRFYIKGGDLQARVREAVGAAGAKGLEVGGQLYVTRTGQGEPKKRGAQPPWFHKVEYVPAAQTFLADGAANGAGNGHASAPTSPAPVATPPASAAPAPAASASSAAQNGGLAFDALAWSYLDDARLAAVQNLITGGVMTHDAARAAFPPPAGWVPPAAGAAGAGIFAGVSRAEFADTMPESIWASIEQLVKTGIPAEQIRSMFGQFLKAK